MLSRLILFLFLFAHLFACEKLSDSPEPDALAGLEIGDINIVLNNEHQSEIQFFSEQKLREINGQISIEITRQPLNGTIELDPDRKVFVYQAKSDWFGKDSAGFKVCSPQTCKSGTIYFFIQDTIPPPCIPVAPNLSFSVNPGTQILSFPDTFPCQASFSALIDNPEPSFIGISNGKIQTGFPEFTNQTYTLKYSICTGLNHCDTGNISIQVRPDSSYCRNRFLPKEDVVIIMPNVVRRSILYDSLFRNDPQTCPNDLIYESLAIVSGPSRGIAELRSNPQGRFIRYTKDSTFHSGSDSLWYSINSRSGKTAQVKLLIKIKP